uniref:Uncharacterized protein n=1 Tax=Corethron hystrix TaxID=216773 RepID=A0A7S1BAC5_9STRA|mmetsp:Transcript_19238/g.43813  ORF Transcript_19238/g.43813 Transcript_19238/m.43813 type:complete len:157 (+) Transcript_19238:168-638(+)|eukprot:CAMPEP_0113312012 /NCGR_PEP_ID=MMETSP0010_2-20120614/9009_1 /TAXON_ID=216773 ORGANISM="Corethron hystrix, Strain 308" /NCGR_SAMPLE_ID=MMETSP0010_2 /ASSEMBLY_ACC=CAM_ASM_000155 /LENGTH=156 /DNA_ID=CAMNT_0000167745 /DNA_START=111 /DNA_END=581 /DNA_ORIENTATION=+ /assembly_acc=CAM_ASM_000155
MPVPSLDQILEAEPRRQEMLTMLGDLSSCLQDFQDLGVAMQEERSTKEQIEEELEATKGELEEIRGELGATKGELEETQAAKEAVEQELDELKEMMQVRRESIQEILQEKHEVLCEMKAANKALRRQVHELLEEENSSSSSSSSDDDWKFWKSDSD